MWCDGLSEEEIEERLLRDGIFTPLLRAARLDKKILKEAKRHARLSEKEKRKLMREAGKLWLARMDHLMRSQTRE